MHYISDKNLQKLLNPFTVEIKDGDATVKLTGYQAKKELLPILIANNKISFIPEQDSCIVPYSIKNKNSQNEWPCNMQVFLKEKSLNVEEASNMFQKGLNVLLTQLPHHNSAFFYSSKLNTNPPINDTLKKFLENYANRFILTDNNKTITYEGIPANYLLSLLNQNPHQWPERIQVLYEGQLIQTPTELMQLPEIDCVKTLCAMQLGAV